PCQPRHGAGDADSRHPDSIDRCNGPVARARACRARRRAYLASRLTTCVRPNVDAGRSQPGKSLDACHTACPERVRFTHSSSPGARRPSVQNPDEADARLFDDEDAPEQPNPTLNRAARSGRPTEDEQLLSVSPAPDPSAFTHTDPWRVLRIT